MSRFARIAALSAALSATLVAVPALAKAPAGVWQNPKGNVRVQFRDCGRGGGGGGTICGRVTWATPAAQAKADAAGGGRLVGRDLFQAFRPSGANQWAGSVLVPDIGQSVSGTITQTGPRTLLGEGCLFAGYGCRQQVWTRVDRGR